MCILLQAYLREQPIYRRELHDFNPSCVNELYQPSVWYVDVTNGFEYDEDNVIKYIDKYLDVI